MKTQKVKIWLLAGLLAVIAGAIGSGRASAATQAVCPSGCTFTQIAPALAAAKNGDTISISAGWLVREPVRRSSAAAAR